jgi:hypothetical protein
VILEELNPGISPENLPNNLTLVDLLKKVGRKQKSYPGQIFPGLLLHQNRGLCPYPVQHRCHTCWKTRQENAVKFTKDRIATFNKELNAIQIKGESSPAAVLYNFQT